MGLKQSVPKPTVDDWILVKPGFDSWYEHDSECDPKTGKPEDWKSEVLSLIRLANFYREQLVWMHKQFSKTDEYRDMKADGYEGISRVEMAINNG